MTNIFDQKSCNRNLRILWIFTVCMNSLFMLAVIVPYYQNQLNLNFHQFLVAVSAFALMLVIWDLPTGWLADQWGRKRSLIMGAATYGLGFVALLYSSGFYSAIAAECVIGIGVALMNGAHTALLYDSLLAAGREHEFRRFEGFRFALGLYMCAFSSVVGGYLYVLSPRLPLALESIMAAIGAGVAILFVEPPRHKRIVEKHPIKDMWDTIKYVTHGHKEIGGLIALMVLTFATTKLCMWALQAYSKEMGLPESYNGWIISATMLLSALFGHFSHKIFPRAQGRHVLYGLLCVLIGAMMVAGWSIAWLGIACLMLEAFVFGFGMPRAQDAINKLAESSRRATILSTASLAGSLGFVPLSQVMGWGADHFGIGPALMLHAAILALCGAGAFVMTQRAHRERATKA